MAARYSVLELSTAVKPWLLRHLHGQTGAARSPTWTPTSRCIGSLERLDRARGGARPGADPPQHRADPAGRQAPSQIDIMIAGVYNLGYVSLAPRPDVERLLDWWADRLLPRLPRRSGLRLLRRPALVRSRRPGFVTDFAIVRDPEYNVAYWNLHSRELEHDGERYLVDGRPLAFFHFSGFDPDRPTELSRHQDRIELADRSGADAHLRRVRGGGARARATRRRALAIQLRRACRRRAVRRHAARGSTSSPRSGARSAARRSAPKGRAAFLAWLATQQPGAPDGREPSARLTSTGRASDLRDAFPDLAGADLGRLLEWAPRRRQGRRARRLAPPAAHRPRPARQIAAAPPAGCRSELWGVNVVGYFRSELGMGEAARQVISALDAHGVPLLPVHGDTIPLSRQGHPYTQFGHATREYPVNLICMNADALPEFADAGGRLVLRRALLDRAVVLGGEPVPQGVDAVVRARSTRCGCRARTSPRRSPRSRRSRPGRCGIPVEMPPLVPRSRAELGLPGRLPVPVLVRLPQRVRAQEPARAHRGVHARVRAGEGASLVIKCINAERRPREPPARCSPRPRSIRTST